jgi:hypothetical protein
MNLAKKDKLELKTVSQQWINSNLPQVKEEIRKMVLVVNNEQETPVMNSEKLTGLKFDSFHISSVEFNQIYRDALLAEIKIDSAELEATKKKILEMRAQKA